MQVSRRPLTGWLEWCAEFDSCTPDLGDLICTTEEITVLWFCDFIFPPLHTMFCFPAALRVTRAGSIIMDAGKAFRLSRLDLCLTAAPRTQSCCFATAFCPLQAGSRKPARQGDCVWELYVWVCAAARGGRLKWLNSTLFLFSFICNQQQLKESLPRSTHTF